MLEGLLPRILEQGVTTRFVVFEGKQDLDKQIERKLRGWLTPESSFLVLRDQDAGDCLMLKTELLRKCAAAGHPETLVRIACRELESWYIGDLRSVEEAFAIPGLVRHGASAKYRNPDKVMKPSAELIRLTKARYQKIAGSHTLGTLLRLESNQSRSFQVFLEGLRRLMS